MAHYSNNYFSRAFFSFVARVIELVERITDLVSGGRVLWGPSLDVIARKK